MGVLSLYSGISAYVKRARRRRQNLKETESSDSERAEIEEMIQEQENAKKNKTTKEEEKKEEAAPEPAPVESVQPQQDIEMHTVGSKLKAQGDNGSVEASDASASQVKPEVQAEAKPEAKEEKPKKKKSCFTCISNPFLFFAAILMCSEWGDRS